jgi:putative tryptophan/tyrosine transport system substrate-binding protein
MNRRAFIAGLGGAVAWPVVARGQQPRKVPRIGILWHGANEQDEASYLKIFRDSLKELGYVEGKNIELLNRFDDEHYDRFDVLAKDLIDAKVDVILASALALSLPSELALPHLLFSPLHPILSANTL